MKTLVTNYTFSATAKQVTLTDYPSIRLDQILLITNVTRNTIIYNFADPAAGGTLAGNVLTLGYNTTTMSDSDRLQIFIEDYVVPSTEASLTAVRIRIDNTNTLLNVLTSSVSATNPRLSSIDAKLTTLIDQTNNIEDYIDLVENRLTNIRDNTSNIPASNSQQTRTVQLSSRLYCSNFYIWSIQGTSFAGYDQFLQVRDGSDNSLLFTQKIKANQNFEFNFWPNGPGAITGIDFDTIIQNSLMPYTDTPGNNDLYLFVRGKSAIGQPGGPT